EAKVEARFVELAQREDPEKFIVRENEQRKEFGLEFKQRRRQARIERIAQARLEGQSTREIAAAEGGSQPQVRRDLQAATETGVSVEPADGKVTGKDGKKRSASRKKKARRPKQKDDTDASGGLVDSLDCPVPPGLVPVFNKVKTFREIVNQLTLINQQL